VHDPVLLIGYMVAVSLTAGFLVGAGEAVSPRWVAIRVVVSAALMLPVWAIYGLPGLAALGLVALPPAGMAAIRLARARRRQTGGEWTPMPAVWLLLEQAVLAGLVVVAWLALREAPLERWFADNVAGPHPGLVDSAVYWATLAAVAWSLIVVNTAGASSLVSLLLPPDASEGAESGPEAVAGYSVKLGPLSGRIEPDRVAPRHALDAVGSTIGAIERLLVVVLILGRAEVGIGLVVAAKTLARFKQLDERHFAERYLIGTLASITIAVAAALLARYALTGF
jgi:hypothetical protein